MIFSYYIFGKVMMAFCQFCIFSTFGLFDRELLFVIRLVFDNQNICCVYHFQRIFHFLANRNAYSVRTIAVLHCFAERDRGWGGRLGGSNVRGSCFVFSFMKFEHILLFLLYGNNTAMGSGNKLSQH